LKISEIKKILETLKDEKISVIKIAEALNMSSANYYERIRNNSYLKTNEIRMLEKYFDVKLITYNASGVVEKIKDAADNIRSNEVTKYNKNYEVMPIDKITYSDDDCVTIDYIGINPSCGCGTMVIDEPEIRKIKLSNDLISHCLKCSHPENLKVFKAQGDSMETLIEDSDLLLVDTGRTDIYNAGIYVFSVDSEWRVKRFRLRLDKVLEIISDNPKYGIEKIMPDNNIEMQIRGKVIKNLSRGL